MAIGVFTFMLIASTIASVPATAAGPIETMPLWHVELRFTTGSAAADATHGFPAVRFNSTTSGVRNLNPQSTTTFNSGQASRFDVGLFATPSQITMLRIGIAGSDDWCIRHVELWLNGKPAFIHDAVGDHADQCKVVKPGVYLEYTSAQLRSNSSWTGYTAPALPSGLNATDLHALVSGITGSTMRSTMGISWDSSVPLRVQRANSSALRVSYRYWVSDGDPHFVDATYDVRLFVGTDRKLHASTARAASADFSVPAAVVAQLDLALSRMTGIPVPNKALRFSIDTYPNITWVHQPQASFLVPAYFGPGPKWQQACSAESAGASRTVLIMNPSSGPGAVRDAAYAAAVNSCHLQGRTVIGYVDTGYATNPTITVANRLTQITQYYDWYGVDGIFFDQMSNAPATHDFYLALLNIVRVHGQHLVIGNPGSPASTPWQLTGPKVADVIVAFEGQALDYLKWTPPAWVTNGSVPSTSVANLVYGVMPPLLPTTPTTQAVCSHSKVVKAGWVDVTFDRLPNPWDILPDFAGMKAYC